MAQDLFEEIAAGWNVRRKGNLSASTPMAFEKRECRLQPVRPGSPEPITEVPGRIRTREALEQALGEMRKAYAPFLRDLAPRIPSFTQRIPVTRFLLDDEKEITVPYYGGPVGKALQKYEAEFALPEDLKDKAVYICFGGADYHASVYINDCCVGMHEGFFSPFEFEITEQVKAGKNALKILLGNDYVYMGSTPSHVPENKRIFGDKLYAATGLGWDDPQIGWHHCPAGMGIYNYVRVEIRNRLHITDLWVRPLVDRKQAEVCVEVENADYAERLLKFSVSVFGQNFEGCFVKEHTYEPWFCFEQGKEVDVSAKGADSYAMPASHGNNQYRILVDLGEELRLWEPETPWLYQVQVSLYHEDRLWDIKKQQFGMRDFSQDTGNTPKGMFYLNGRKTRLRGANTMGFEQQDVLRGDYGQLIDDILLGKLCNMNFWRLTQRPVQDEVYEYCDKLGLMTQTDLPLFGVMRRTKFAEGLRQAEEMARMVRKHPCNVVISYINEPNPYGWVRPHRNMLRNELEDFFASCDAAVKLHHPDCVIKHVDGDYDPPTRNSIADNHCYNLWYNGHAIHFGRLYRGYWVDTDKEWYCGCGEYGAEGLDYKDLMLRRYPKEWLKEPFDPSNIVIAQALGNHGHFFDTPTTIDEWVEETQKHQAFAAKMMTESFRRRPDMISTAIHLFIDAWPSGWMKSIMDCERRPKPAYFACREAYAPVLVTLRSDRFTYYAGEPISIETYISNDPDESIDGCQVVYELWSEGKRLLEGRTRVDVKPCDVTYAANGEFRIEQVEDRQKFVLKAFVLDGNGKALSANEFPFEVFAREDPADPETPESVVWIDDLKPGTYEIAGETVTVYPLSRNLFVSRATGHPAVARFEKEDFKLWYNKKEDMITPIADRTFVAEGFRPVLQSNNSNSGCKRRRPEPQTVVGEKLYQGKRYIISCLDLRLENPVAKRFQKALFGLGTPEEE